MKVAKVTLFTLLAALVAVGVSTTSYAFHSGGVAECAGCHSMHSPAVGGTRLLVGTDASSACLTVTSMQGTRGLPATTSAPISRICRQVPPRCSGPPAGTSVG